MAIQMQTSLDVADNSGARRGRFEGRKPSWKKAYVTLKEGEKPLDYGEAI